MVTFVKLLVKIIKVLITIFKHSAFLESLYNDLSEKYL